MKNVIEARGLSLELGGLRVLDRIQLNLDQGQCLGVAGVGHAGKTALLRTLAGLLKLTQGELFVLEMNAKINAPGIRARVGFVPEDDGFDLNLTCLDALLSHGALYGIPTSRLKILAKDLLRRIQLDEAENWPIHELKRGPLRRLSIARGLMNQPDILFVDGPIQNLPASERKILWTLFHDLKMQGLTMVIASRDLDELEKLCDKVIILNRGTLACEGPPEKLIAQHIGHQVIEYDVQPHDVEYHLQALKGQFQYQLVGERLRIFLPENVDAQTAIRWVPSDRILFRRAFLKDVYVKVTGHDLGGGPL